MNQEIITAITKSPYCFYFLVAEPHLYFAPSQPLANFYTISTFNQNNSVPSQNFSLQEQGVSLAVNNSGNLLAHPHTVEFIKSTSAGRQVVIIPFKPSAKIEKVCTQNSWIVAANNYHLNRELEDKVKFSLLCQQQHFPTIPSLTGNFSQSLYESGRQAFGPELIIQTHFGWAGQSTIKSGNFDDVKTKVEPDTPVKISPYLQGYTLTNNCCLTRYNVLQSPPALQLTGIAPLTNNPFATVGRQWPSSAPSDINNLVINLTSKVADSLKKLHYKGFFGLDFLISGQQVFLLECNPRLTASFEFYSALEEKFDVIPLFYLHLAEFTHLEFAAPAYDPGYRLNLPLVGTEITPRTPEGSIDKKIHLTTAITDNPLKTAISEELIYG